MPESKAPLASQLSIKVDGSDVDGSVMGNILELIADQHSHLPDMFTIRLADSGLALLDGGPFDLTKSVEISGKDAEGKASPILSGEITAIEPVFDEGLVGELIVRGYDKSHRLYRETRSKAYLNIKDSDLASQIGQTLGLKAVVDATPTVYEHLYQNNLSDLAFLKQRAWRIGYECFVQGDSLYFRKPPPPSGGGTLKWGEDLQLFTPRLTLAEQVDEVMVQGWDAEKLEPIIGKASDATFAKIDESKNGTEWASTFGTGKYIVVDQPVVSQAEATIMAEARLGERAGAFVQAQGVAFRRPDITAGKHIKIDGVGKRLSGTYLVTSAKHIYSEDGLYVHFVVSGARSHTLSEQMRGYDHTAVWNGIVVGIVTNTDDPNDWGRVKIKYPWMSDEAESHWARLIAPGAGPDAGFAAIPDVGDEVMVAFEQGNFDRPYVLGGTWNGKHAPPPNTVAAAAGEKPLVRSWQSRTGHHITMYDDAKEMIQVETAGGHSVVIDDASKLIEITSTGGLVISMDDGGNEIKIKSGGKISIESGGNFTIKSGANLELSASGQLSIKGAMVKLN